MIDDEMNEEMDELPILSYPLSHPLSYPIHRVLSFETINYLYYYCYGLVVFFVLMCNR